MTIRAINEHEGYPKNDVIPELLGASTGCLVLAPDTISGARLNMVASHGSSATRIAENEKRMIFTGEEREYAKYMFDVRVLNNSRLLAVHEYIDKNDMDAQVLERYYFMEDLVENVIKVYVVPTYQKHTSSSYGYELNMTEAGRNMSIGDSIKGGTIIATTPSWIDGEIAPGTHANAMIVSNQLVIEDAFPFSARLSDKMLTYGYTTHIFDLSGGDQPLFLYGTDDEPRIHPDVGEKVRKDGILFAKRQSKVNSDNEEVSRHDLLISAVELSDKNLKIPCGYWDTCEYVDVEAEVISIKVVSHPLNNHNSRINEHGFSSNLKTAANVQQSLLTYDQTFKEFHRRMVNIEKKLKGTSKAPLSPEVINMMTNSRMFCAETHRTAPKIVTTSTSGEVLGDYRIEIIIKYPIPFEESSKGTDFCGGKGVGSYKMDYDHTPVDEFGNEVDIFLASNATQRRNIGSRPYEMYLNAAKRDARLRMIEMLDKDGWQVAWDYLMGFYECVSPPYRDIIEEEYPSDEEREDALREIANAKGDNLRIWRPSQLGKPIEVTMKELEENYSPRKSRIKFFNPVSEKWELTVEEHIVGAIYYQRLDKSGREYFANASARYNVFGIPIKANKSSKARRPTVESTIRHRSEADNKYTAAFIPGPLASELMDQSLNPSANRQYLMKIFDSGTPRQLDVGYDRDVFKLGNHRIHQFVNHNMLSDGISFTKGDKDKEND